MCSTFNSNGINMQMMHLEVTLYAKLVFRVVHGGKIQVNISLQSLYKPGYIRLIIVQPLRDVYTPTMGTRWNKSDNNFTYCIYVTVNS
jgi:hypothetical protein